MGGDQRAVGSALPPILKRKEPLASAMEPSRPDAFGESLQRHFDVLDALEVHWADKEPYPDTLRLKDGRNFRPSLAIRLSKEMEIEILHKCGNENVSPANLLAIGCRSTIRGKPVPDAKRFNHFGSKNPLLLATIQRIVEDTLDSEQRGVLIDELKRKADNLAADPSLDEKTRQAALCQEVINATRNHSALIALARQALGNKIGSIPANLKRQLESFLAQPHPMQSIVFGFISHASRYRDEQRDVLAAHVVSILCARFNSNLPALRGILASVERQLDQANAVVTSIEKRSTAPGDKSERARRANRAATIIAVDAATAALNYLENETSRTAN